MICVTTGWSFSLTVIHKTVSLVLGVIEKIKRARRMNVTPALYVGTS